MRSILAVLVLVLCIVIAAAGVSRAETVIGIFSDAGTSCSFSGNNAGLVTAHVVVRTTGDGVRGVRFKAPIPSCFDAVFVADVLPEGLNALGDSQTGISIAIPGCADLPTHVLDITYFASGGTAPCCEFPLVADPIVGYLEAIDCSFNSIEMQSLTAYMNADSTCECSMPPTPPSPPAVVYPPDGATQVNRTVALSWAASDPDFLEVTCDLYFGTTADPLLLAANLPGSGVWTYIPPTLSADTIHYWKVVARNSAGGETTGPVWQFRTRGNDIPVVTLTTPANGATIVPLSTVLRWTATDSSPLTYDVYFGTNPLSLPVVATGLADPEYSPPLLAYSTQYHWRVVATDTDGGQGTSSTWSFTTRPVNLPPNAPFTPSPANNATNVSPTPTLAWGASDPDGQALTFDVYLGTATNPPLVASNVGVGYHATLQFQTKYYWRVVARDTGGLTTSGPLWNFTTRVNLPPSAPSNPQPSNNATAQSLTSTLSWTGTDPDGPAPTFDVYFGNTSPPPLVSGNQAASTYDPGPLAFGTQYYWRIVARDVFGAENIGALWFFTTRSENEPPVFLSATPGDGTTNVPTYTDLQWIFVELDGQALTYDVYFGNVLPPPLVASNISATTFDPGPLAALTTYRWRIVARDETGQESSMAVRAFVTTPFVGGAPFSPSNPSPPNNGVAPAMPLLFWQGGDPDGDTVRYEVYMTFDDPQLVLVGATTSPSFQLTQGLVPGRLYYWYVMAFDETRYTQGPLWSFTVSGPPIPVAFTAFDAVHHDGAIDVTWSLASDEEMERYTLYRREGKGAMRQIAQGTVRSSDSYRDASIAAGMTYSYELVVRTSDGDEFRSPVSTVSTSSLALALHQNVPNPFNPQTAIRFDLVSSSRVRLAVFDVNGRLIRTLVDGERTAGTHEVIWTGRDDADQPVSSGMYFYVLDAGKERLTRKLVLLK